MINNKTKLFLLFTLIFVAVIGISSLSAVDVDSAVSTVEDATSNNVADIPSTTTTNNNVINTEKTYDNSNSNKIADNTVKTLKKESKNEKQYLGQVIANLSTSKTEYVIGENVDVTLKLSVEGQASHNFGDIEHAEVVVKFGSRQSDFNMEGYAGVNPTYTTRFSTNGLTEGSYNIYMAAMDLYGTEEIYLSDCQTNTVTVTLTNNAPEPSHITVDNVTFTKTQDAVLAYNNTNVTVKVSNDGAACDEANVIVTIGGESKTLTVNNLGTTPQNLVYEYYFTTSGAKDVGVVIDYLNGTTTTAYTGTVNVIASGYMGKSFTNNTNMTNAVVYDGYNTLNVFGNLFDYKSNQPVSFSFDAAANGLVDSDKIIDVLYYQPWGTWNGQTANIILSLNDEELSYMSSYSDKKGFGGYDFPYGLYVYNITGKLSLNDVNNFNIAPVSGSTGYAYFYGGYIVAIYENSTKRTVINIAEDCDALSAGTSSSYGATPETAITYANYNGIATSDLSSAYVTVMANNANNQEYIYVNDIQKALLKDSYNYGSQVAIATVDVKGDIATNNVVAVKCVEDTSVYVLTSILVLEYDEPIEQPDISVDSVTFTKTQNKIYTYNDTNVTVTLHNDGGLCQEANIILTVGDESKTLPVYNLENIPQSLVYNCYFIVPGQKTVTVSVDYLNGTIETLYTGSVTLTQYYTTVSSETLTTKASGMVTGGLYHNAIQNPSFDSSLGKHFKSDVSFTFVDPAESYSSIATARLYAVLYDNRDSASYFINISVDGDNDGEYESVIEDNHYITLSTTADSTVYKLNDNITKVYTDYCLFYDITDSINSDTINVELNSSRGAIKCIGLIVAYNQEDSNKEVNYWINFGSAWSNSNSIISNFATRGITADDVNLKQSITSSSNPTSKFNDNQLTYTKSPSGYFGIESWNVTEYYDSSKNSQLVNIPGGSFKTSAATLALTTINEPVIPDPNISVDNVTFTKTQNAVLAYNDTNVTVTVTNDGAVCDEANVILTIDGESKTLTVTNLDTTPQNLVFEYYFTTAGTKDVDVVIDYLNGTTNTAYTGSVDVIASGYMGKSFTNNTNMTNTAVYDGNNTLNIFGNLFAYKSNQAVSFSFDAAANGLIDSDKIVDVFYYQPWGTWNGQTANIIVTLNDEELSYMAAYSDKKGFGGYDFPYGLYVYNISDKLSVGEVNNFNIAPVSGGSGYAYFYGGYIVAIYANSTYRSVISIAEDCDALSAGTSSSYGATPETAIAYANFNAVDTVNVSKAYVTVMANNANNQEYLYMNDFQKALLKDSYDYSSQVAIATADVTGDIAADNVVAVKCVQDTSVYVLTSILVVEYEEPLKQINIDVDDITAAKADDITLTLTLNDTLTDGKVSVLINDEEIASITEFDSDTITIENIDTSSFDIGENTITVSYTDSDKYEDFTTTAILTLTTRQVTLTVQPLNIGKSVRETVLTVNFNDTLSDGVINVYSNNKQLGIYTITEECNSVDVTLSNINLPLGEYDLTVSYADSQLYDEASATTTLTIIKPNTNISIDPVVLTANKTVTITARVDAVDTDAVVDSGKVVFKLNGKTLKDENGKVIYVKVVDGIASIDYSLADITNFDNLEITATYSGSSAFESSKSAAVTVETPSDITTAVITLDDMTAKVGDTITINATVKDLAGNNVQSGKVIFKINGKTIKDSNGKVVYANIVDGRVSIDYDTSGLKVRSYTLSVVMSANSLYDRTQTDATLTVEE
ncbi:MAG: DUF3344 domain-containing protein [Methanosphaera sp.]|nr:DUF3344 domain-containing protein [Methanosphaera sp.]